MAHEVRDPILKQARAALAAAALLAPAAAWAQAQAPVDPALTAPEAASGAAQGAGAAPGAGQGVTPLPRVDPPTTNLPEAATGTATESLTGAPSPGLSGSPDGAREVETSIDSQKYEFIQQALASGMAEVQLGQLALERAGRQEVRTFAQRMVEDHGRANDELSTIVVNIPHDLQLAPQLTEDQERMAQHLAQLSGADFDREYMAHMVQSHEQTVALYQQQVAHPDQGPLGDFAATTLPILQEHLMMARQLAQTITTAGG